MKRCTLDEVGKIFRVIRCGKYVVLIGGRLWIFTENGDLVAYKKDIIHPGHVVQLQDDRILLMAGKAGMFVLLSLSTGEELHRFPFPKMDLPLSPFVLTPDTSHIYGCYEIMGKYYCMRINTETWAIETRKITEDGMFAICDIICDSEGNLCLLETRFEENESEHVSINRIRVIEPKDFFASGIVHERNRWKFPHTRDSVSFVNNSETVLTNDLFVYNLTDWSRMDLLANEADGNRFKEHFSESTFSDDQKHLILPCMEKNVIVSLEAKKIVAQYNARYKIGCLINGKFWLPDEEGVKQKEFPCFEEIVPSKYIFWKPY